MNGLFLALVVVGAFIAVPATAATSRGVEVTLNNEAEAEEASSETVKLYNASLALVIGIDRYDNWPTLSNAVKDAQLVADALKQHGFEVTFKTNLKAGELREALETFFIEKGKDSEARLFFWFAGHGHTERGQGYIVPIDAPKPDDDVQFRRNALSLLRFGEYVREARAKHVFAIFDSCFSGTIFDASRSIPPPAITRVTTLPVRQFLTSGDAGQEVSDDGRFRRLFVEALANKRDADANRDGYLTASELGLFLSGSVSNYTNNSQTPRYGKLRDPEYDRGDFVFKLARAEKKEEVQKASEEPRAVSADQETLFWTSIKDSADPRSFEAYLSQFPHGTFATLARLSLEKLESEDKKEHTDRQSEAVAPLSKMASATSGGGSDKRSSEASEAQPPDAVPMAELAYAKGLLQDAKFEEAERTLKKVISSKTSLKDPEVQEAHYWLGETYYTRGLYKEASDTFLEGYENNKAGARAPEMLLKLGQSLSKLDKKLQACGTLDALDWEYPDASADVRQKALEERRHLGCQ